MHAGTRIGDYDLTRSLPAIVTGILEYEATHVLLPRVARVRVARANDAAGRHLVREAYILESLRHPGVPRVFECGLLEDRRPWIALEACDGSTLGAVPPSETLALLRDLAEVLHHAHTRGISHGHVRAELIVRHAAGVCLTGWGDAATHDQAGFDEHADIAALGRLLYHATLPRPIAALLSRMMTSTVVARPTAAEVRAEALRLIESFEDAVEEVEIELIEDPAADPIAIRGAS